ncbi:hypothetical protein GCM10023172_29280 [Hymenobacter ginsengisoli]|uniref:DUF1735 domain-containing protein n=1 Tax=Hymenobacter ginsengisoli TaxID=1051626 RepID=A0ABP8QJY9_9BACT|nr:MULTISPECIES: hypothetical protein [unclassified Hymenobacter]MBO2029815.1 hypothetical protein [Hymenobacter sp. BT559]
MKKSAIQFLFLLVLVAGFAGCKKDYGNKLGPLQDSVAAIPITVTNQVYFERFPVVTAKVDTTNGLANSTGSFSITLSIPADKGKIKEITKVATGNSGVEYLQSNLYPNYLTTPVAGNGSNTITFSSDLNAVRNYVTRLNAAFPTLPAGSTKTAAYAFTENLARRKGTLTPNSNPQTPNQLRFFFLITLEDGTQLISTEVDVRLIF